MVVEGGRESGRERGERGWEWKGEQEGLRKVHNWWYVCHACMAITPPGPHLNLTTFRPLGRMMSGFRFSRHSTSLAVTSDTVLKMCAQCAAARSRQ